MWWHSVTEVVFKRDVVLVVVPVAISSVVAFLGGRWQARSARPVMVASWAEPRVQVVGVGRHFTTKVSAVVKLSNAGNSPAWNVAVFAYEALEAMVPRQYKVTGIEGGERLNGALLPNDVSEMEVPAEIFEGCTATASQELWIECSDGFGKHYRTVLRPSYGRGDHPSVAPPFKIIFRLPRLPEQVYSGKGSDRALRRGTKFVGWCLAFLLLTTLSVPA